MRILVASMLFVTAYASADILQVHTPHQPKQFEPYAPYVCDIYEVRMDFVKETYGQRLYTNNSGIRKRALEVFTRLPSEVLEFITITNNVPIYLTGYGSGGVAYWRGYPYTPTRIETGVRSQNGNFDALPHEIGHASQGFFQRMSDQFQPDLKAAYRYAVTEGRERRHMRNYAATNFHEFFAEFFDQYFCSQEARDNLVEKFPNTFESLDPYLSQVMPDWYE